MDGSAEYVVNFRARTPAILEGSLEGSLPADADLSLEVNGLPGQSYTFVEQDFPGGMEKATLDEVAAVINREFVGIQAYVTKVQEKAKLSIRTDRTGQTLPKGWLAGILGFSGELVQGATLLI